jgi:uncharacterized membrane protein YdbT with pleckstrin-like domain
MSYIEQSLSDNEKVEAVFKLHWITRVPMVLWLLAAPVTFGVTLLFAVYEYLRLKNVEQGVTNKRVIIKRGIISRSTDEMKLKSIETVELDQGIFGRMCGFGTLKITGQGLSDFFFIYIDDPLSVKRRIESISNPID